jgi:hypothetical protein
LDLGELHPGIYLGPVLYIDQNLIAILVETRKSTTKNKFLDLLLPCCPPLSFNLNLLAMTYDPQYMTLAMEAAHNAYDSLEVPVGCVFVRNGEVLAKGGNRPNASLNVRCPLAINGIPSDQV